MAKFGAKYESRLLKIKKTDKKFTFLQNTSLHHDLYQKILIRERMFSDFRKKYKIRPEEPVTFNIKRKIREAAKSECSTGIKSKSPYNKPGHPHYVYYQWCLIVFKIKSLKIPPNAGEPRREETKVRSCKDNQMSNTEKDWCAKALKKLINSKCSLPFRRPVDAELLGLPNYHTIIRKPIDLSKIREKMEKGEYKSALEFEFDIQLMINNCFVYNSPEDTVYGLAKDLQNIFGKLFYIRYIVSPISVLN